MSNVDTKKHAVTGEVMHVRLGRLQARPGTPIANGEGPRGVVVRLSSDRGYIDDEFTQGDLDEFLRTVKRELIRPADIRAEAELGAGAKGEAAVSEKAAERSNNIVLEQTLRRIATDLPDGALHVWPIENRLALAIGDELIEIPADDACEKAAGLLSAYPSLTYEIQVEVSGDNEKEAEAAAKTIAEAEAKIEKAIDAKDDALARAFFGKPDE